MNIKEIRIEDFDYNLPDERIAKYPLPQRDGSKLLHYKEKRYFFVSLPVLGKTLCVVSINL